MHQQEQIRRLKNAISGLRRRWHNARRRFEHESEAFYQFRYDLIGPLCSINILDPGAMVEEVEAVVAERDRMRPVVEAAVEYIGGGVHIGRLRASVRAYQSHASPGEVPQGVESPASQAAGAVSGDQCYCGATDYATSATIVQCRNCGRTWGLCNGVWRYDHTSAPNAPAAGAISAPDFVLRLVTQHRDFNMGDCWSNDLWELRNGAEPTSRNADLADTLEWLVDVFRPKPWPRPTDPAAGAIEPASPLPWERVDGWIHHSVGAPTEKTVVMMASADDDADAAYIVHACNAYPKLVAERDRLAERAATERMHRERNLAEGMRYKARAETAEARVAELEADRAALAAEMAIEPTPDAMLRRVRMMASNELAQARGGVPECVERFSGIPRQALDKLLFSVRHKTTGIWKWRNLAADCLEWLATQPQPAQSGNGSDPIAPYRWPPVDNSIAPQPAAEPAMRREDNCRHYDGGECRAGMIRGTLLPDDVPCSAWEARDEPVAEPAAKLAQPAHRCWSGCGDPAWWRCKDGRWSCEGHADDDAECAISEPAAEPAVVVAQGGDVAGIAAGIRYLQQTDPELVGCLVEEDPDMVELGEYSNGLLKLLASPGVCVRSASAVDELVEAATLYRQWLNRDNAKRLDKAIAAMAE